MAEDGPTRRSGHARPDLSALEDLRVRLRRSWLRLRVSRRGREAAIWLLPLAVGLAVRRWPESRLSEVVGLGAVLALFSWAARKPGRAIVALVVFQAFQQIGLGLLWHVGIPGAFLRPAGGVKEVLGLGVLAAALQNMRDERHRLDLVDKLALAYVAAVAIHLTGLRFYPVVPDPGLSLRLIAARADIGYVLLFLGYRHAPLTDADRDRFIRAVLLLSGVVCVLAIGQRLAPGHYLSFLKDQAEWVQFQVRVLHTSPQVASAQLAYAGLHPVQVGSIFASPYDMADYLLLPFGLCMNRLVRRDPGFFVPVLAGLIVLAVYFSGVRADAVAIVAIVGFALRPRADGNAAARLRTAIVVVAACVVMVPALAGSRFFGGGNASLSTAQHKTELAVGVGLVQHYPLGLGLGYNPATAGRFVLADQRGNLTSDNSVLQVGAELGWEAMVPFVLLLLGVFVALARRSKEDEERAGGVWLAYSGLVVAGMFHHVFLGYAVSWTLWGAVGVALPSTRRAAPPPLVGPGAAYPRRYAVPSR